MGDEQWSAFRRKQDALGRLLDMLREVRVSPDAATSDAFRELGEPVPNKSQRKYGCCYGWSGCMICSARIMCRTIIMP